MCFNFYYFNFTNFMLLFTHYFTIHREYLRRMFIVHFQIHSITCPNLIFKKFLQNDCWRRYTLLPRSFINIIYIVVIKVCETTNFSCGFNLYCPFIGRIGGGDPLLSIPSVILSTRHLMMQVTESVEDCRMLDVGHGIDRGLPNETRVKTTCILILTQMRDQSINDILISVSAVVIVIFNCHFHNYCLDLDSDRGTCILQTFVRVGTPKAISSASGAVLHDYCTNRQV